MAFLFIFSLHLFFYAYQACPTNLSPTSLFFILYDRCYHLLNPNFIILILPSWVKAFFPQENLPLLKSYHYKAIIYFSLDFHFNQKKDQILTIMSIDAYFASIIINYRYRTNCLLYKKSFT